MENGVMGIRLRGRLIDSLYTEAMVLADEARSYFDQEGRLDREQLTPLMRVTLSCESLKITTRLMNMLSWLLTQRAVELGQIEAAGSKVSTEWVNEDDEQSTASLAGLPRAAIALIEASRELQARVRRIDSDPPDAGQSHSPALGLLDRLERAF
jgi:regulator of CtrA degradation